MEQPFIFKEVELDDGTLWGKASNKQKEGWLHFEDTKQNNPTEARETAREVNPEVTVIPASEPTAEPMPEATVSPAPKEPTAEPLKNGADCFRNSENCRRQVEEVVCDSGNSGCDYRCCMGG